MTGLCQIACCCKERMGTYAATRKYARLPYRSRTNMHIVSGDRRIDFSRLILNLKARDCAATPIRFRLSSVPILSTSPSRLRRAHRPVAPGL